MSSSVMAVLPVLALGFAAGILSGMFGIGGGLVIVPALIFLFHVPFKTATGTSLFALLWPVGILGVAEYWKQGQLNVSQGAWIAVGLFLGAWFGAQITLTLPVSTMKKCYAVFLLIAGAWYLFGPDPKKAGPASAPPNVPVTTPASPNPDQVH